MHRRSQFRAFLSSCYSFKRSYSEKPSGLFDLYAKTIEFGLLLWLPIFYIFYLDLTISNLDLFMCDCFYLRFVFQRIIKEHE